MREPRRAGRIGAVDDDDLDAGRQACAQLRHVRVAPARVGGGDVGLAQHDHRRDAARQHERQVALESAQVEVVVEPHDDKRAVDVADDRMSAAVAVAAGDVRGRLDAHADPEVARGVGADPDPVADRDRVAAVVAAQQARQDAGRARRAAVVHLHGRAVDGGDAHQRERGVAAVVALAVERLASPARQRLAQADAGEKFEIEVVHVNPKTGRGRRLGRRRRGHAGAIALRRDEALRRAAGAGFGARRSAGAKRRRGD